MYFHWTEKPYIAVIGDIKTSKQLSDRESVQESLKNTLHHINETYQEDIAAKFVITLGDEFQGLLTTGAHLLHILLEIEQALYPVKLRFGIGIGAITTQINQAMALGADGPGYYYARSAITQVKQNESKKQTVVTSIQIETTSDNMGIINMLNTMLALLDTIKEGWSERQRQIIWDMLAHQDSQSAAANRFGIQQPAIQKSLAKGNYYIYKDTIDIIENTLKEIGQYV